MDVLLGYQWWREKYEGFGVLDELGAVGDVPSGTKAITHEWTWQSVRVGARTEVPLFKRLDFRLSAFVLPWSSLRVEDTHLLRPDLARPSAITDATGGFGWQVDASLVYTFWRGLGVQLGYRHWDVSIDEGDVKIRSLVAGTQSFNSTTRRQSDTGSISACSIAFSPVQRR